ncbi:MAG TPA: YHS domain-containing protein [Anaerolineae bacterium]
MHDMHSESHEHGKHLAPGQHIDPICGMTVEEGPTAITMEYKGETYYFCSRGCRRSFEKDPEAALRKGPQGHM